MNRATRLAWALVFAAATARSQQPTNGSPGMPGPPPAGQPASIPGAMSGGLTGSGGADNGAFAAASRERLEKGRQTERQRKLVADTDRLLTLANELKADMDKTTKDTLSIEVIKKAEEIEKLAKSVKDRMRG